MGIITCDAYLLLHPRRYCGISAQVVCHPDLEGKLVPQLPEGWREKIYDLTDHRYFLCPEHSHLKTL